MTLRLATLLLLVAAMPVASASAVPIMQDSFYVFEPANPAMGEYDAGLLDPGSGQNPVTIGSAGNAWNASNTGTIRVTGTGLTYPGALATGGRAYFEHSASLDDARTGVRTLSQSYDLGASAYYVSGLMSFDGEFGVGVVDDPNTTVDESGDSFYSTAYMGYTNQVDPYDNRTTTPDPTDTGGALILGTQWGFQGDGAGGVNAMMRIREASEGDLQNVVLGSGISAGTHQFVFKIEPDYSGSSERITAWLNPPSLASEAAAGTPTLGPSLFSNWSTSNSSRILDTLSISARNVGPNAQVGFDEFRFGTSWEDVFVTPEQHVGYRQIGGQYEHVGTELREGEPNIIQFDDDGEIRVGYISSSSVGNMRTVLGFDVADIPAGATITGASLTIQPQSVDLSGDQNTIGDFELRRLTTGPVVESEATWNEYASGQAWTNPGGDLGNLLGTAPGFTSEADADDRVISTAELAAAVQDALDNGTQLDLAMLAPATEDGGTGSRAFVRWHSDDAGSSVYDRPILTVTYAAPIPEPSTVVLLAIGVALGLLGRRRR